MNKIDLKLIKEYVDRKAVGNGSANLDGVVTGPSSAVSGHIPAFSDATGKIIQDGYGVQTSLSSTNAEIPTASAVADYVEKAFDNHNYYAICETAAATQTKVVSIPEITAVTAGMHLYIKFTTGQTYNGQPKIQINNLTALPVYRYGTTKATRYEWVAGETVHFIYDGTYLQCVDAGTATVSYFGITKLSNGIATTTSAYAATPYAVNMAMSMMTGLSVYSSASTTSYNVGDRVRYGNSMYECHTSIAEGEAFTSAKWTQLDPLLTRIESLASTMSAKAPLASPAFTGTPTAPTASSGTNTTQIATTAFVQNAISGISGGSGGTLNWEPIVSSSSG